MKEYLLVTVIKGCEGNAGPKAPQDICNILKETGKVESVLLGADQGLDYPVFLRLIDLLKRARREDRKIILQYPLQPYYYYQMQELFSQALSYLNPDKTVLWIHDINQIRFAERPVYQAEMKWLQPFKHFIVHNSAMERYLRKYLQMENCIQNEIFDYICTGHARQTDCQVLADKEPTLVFAGYLGRSKVPFLYELEKEKMSFRINAFGRREDLLANEKICYRGSFEANELPWRLNGDLGLIWDGQVDSKVDTSAQKNYTRYNTPHKFSCYITAGLPVIAWKEAAIAEITRKYQVGYLIENLYEINNLDFSRYREYQRNVFELSKKIQSGYFTKRVFKMIEQIV